MSGWDALCRCSVDIQGLQVEVHFGFFTPHLHSAKCLPLKKPTPEHDGIQESLLLRSKVCMEVSSNRGTPKSSISMAFSMINHPKSRIPHFRKPPHGVDL